MNARPQPGDVTFVPDPVEHILIEDSVNCVISRIIRAAGAHIRIEPTSREKGV